MTSEREAMSLEQVRDAILRFMDSHDDAAGSQSLTDCVMALNAHLSRAAEPVDFPKRRANVPYPNGFDGPDARLVGFIITPDHPWYGTGLSSPLFALEKALGGTQPPEPARDATFTDEAVARLARSINLNPDITLKPMKSLIAWLRGAIDASMQANPDAKDTQQVFEKWFANHGYEGALIGANIKAALWQTWQAAMQESPDAKDAARWRWWREHMGDVAFERQPDNSVQMIRVSQRRIYAPEFLDKQTDAAMAQESGDE